MTRGSLRSGRRQRVQHEGPKTAETKRRTGRTARSAGGIGRGGRPVKAPSEFRGALTGLPPRPMPLAGHSAGDATGPLVDAARQPPFCLRYSSFLRVEPVVSVPSRRRGSGQCCSRLAFVDARIFRSASRLRFCTVERTNDRRSGAGGADGDHVEGGFATGVGGVDRHGQREAGVEVVVGVDLIGGNDVGSG